MTTRRDFLRGSSLTLLGAAVPVAGWPAAALRDEGPPGTGQGSVEADTRHGRIRGLQQDGICCFKGIPYGAPTDGDQRFLPPRPPPAWTRVRDCLAYGPVCPQTLAGGPAGDLAPGGMGEDCLNLNVWTPALRDGQRRPVLVGFHGDGFARGSANGRASEGAALARAGDVVVIGVNHRLGRFGYLQLADRGAPAEFAQAGVAGLMDLTAALEWVRDNAEQFGGDAHNVMIFGQSGGGAKVSSLLATPAAQGLFHRAAVQSGSLLRFAPRATADRQAKALLQSLRIGRGHLRDLQSVPWQQLLNAPLSGPDAAVGARPVLDGQYLAHHPFDIAAPDESATVPLLVSSTLEDDSSCFTNLDLAEAGLRAILDQRFPGRGREILSLYRRYYPERAPFLIQGQVFTDAGRRRAALRQAELKASQGKGPIFVYQWDWAGAGGSPYGATHGLDVSATYLDARQQETSRLARQLSSAWVSFARSGIPAVAQMPAWPGYDVTTRATMVFGTPTQLVNDPRGEIRLYWQHAPPTDDDSV